MLNKNKKRIKNDKNLECKILSTGEHECVCVCMCGFLISLEDGVGSSGTLIGGCNK